LNIVTLCTGNAARSVMLGYMLTTLAEVNGESWHIRTAGTHVIEGSAMSSRTRDALMSIEELRGHHFNQHRSHQLSELDVQWADVILASEVANVNFVRAHFATTAVKCVQFEMFVSRASRHGTFADRLASFAGHDPSPGFDVVDPAGGDQAVYHQCAQQLWVLAQGFALLARTDDELR
jgi:protein-tyrosine-phosphatase